MQWYHILAIVLASVLLLLSLIIFIVIKAKKNKGNNVVEFLGLLEALGGKENIVESSSKGSRVNVIVNDKKLIDKEKIKAEGVETMVVSNKKVTMVVDSKKAVQINEYLIKELGWNISIFLLFKNIVSIDKKTLHFMWSVFVFTIQNVFYLWIIHLNYEEHAWYLHTAISYLKYYL